MEAKHTKGEWQAKAPNPYADESAGERMTYHWVVRTSYEPANGGARGHQVCEISSMNTGTEEADARLIAAAPELLDIAKRTEDMLTRQRWRDDGGDPESKLLRDCRAAIAKATQ